MGNDGYAGGHQYINLTSGFCLMGFEIIIRACLGFCDLNFYRSFF